MFSKYNVEIWKESTFCQLKFLKNIYDEFTSWNIIQPLKTWQTMNKCFRERKIMVIVICKYKIVILNLKYKIFIIMGSP